jgi:hypothetical protein
MVTENGGMAKHWEMSGCRCKRANASIHIKASHHVLTVIMARADPRLVTQGWVGDKPCFMTVGMGAYVTVTRLDIAVGWPERQPKQCYTLQTVSGEALLILKAVFLTLTLGWRPLKIWVFVANITNEFILWLDILQIYNASVDLGRHMLHLQRKRHCYGGPGWGPGPPTW